MTDARTNIAIPSDIHQDIKMETARRGITVMDACREAFPAWLSKSQRKPGKVIPKPAPELVTR